MRYLQDRTIKNKPPIPPAGGSGELTTTTRIKPTRRRDANEDPRFVRFWTSYPRQENRKKAVEAFTRLAPDDTLFEAMMAALERQKLWPKWTKDGGQFIPHATTWINNSRWDDRPPDVPSQKDTPPKLTLEEAKRRAAGESLEQEDQPCK